MYIVFVFLIFKFNFFIHALTYAKFVQMYEVPLCFSFAFIIGSPCPLWSSGLPFTTWSLTPTPNLTPVTPVYNYVSVHLIPHLHTYRVKL